jgi:hypothetical protein
MVLSIPMFVAGFPAVPGRTLDPGQSRNSQSRIISDLRVKIMRIFKWANFIIRDDRVVWALAAIRVSDVGPFRSG